MLHMVIFINVVDFLMTPLMNCFTSVVMDDQNLDETHANYRTKVGYVLYLNVGVIKILSWMIET